MAVCTLWVGLGGCLMDGPEFWSDQGRPPAVPAVSAPRTSTVPADDRPLTLADVLRMAAQSRLVRQSELDLERALAEAQAGRAALLPALTAEGRVSHQVEMPRVGVFVFDTPLADRFSVGGRLVAEWSMDVSGRRQWALRAAQSEARGATADRQDRVSTVQLLALELYFDVMSLQHARQVTLDSLQALESQLRNANALVANGKATANEALIVEVRTGERRQDLLRLDHALRKSVWSLNRIVTLPVDRPTALVAVSPAFSSIPDMETCVAEAIRTNPQRTAGVARVQAAYAGFRAARANYWPDAVIQHSEGYTTDDEISPRDRRETSVMLKWGLYDGDARKASVRKSKALWEQTQTALDELDAEIEAEVRGAVLDVIERRNAIDVAQRSMQQAEENLRIVQEKFRTQKATSQEVLEAEATLSRQKTSRFDAEDGLLVATARLHRLMGRSLEAFAAECTVEG